MKNECECPELLKTRGKSNPSEKSKGRRAYIVWEDDETSSTRSDSDNDEVAHLCFMGQKKKPFQECFATTRRNWYLDSGCSRHMRGDPSMFIDF